MKINETFLKEFGTVRECIDCGCLTAGGPTRCVRCVEFHFMTLRQRIKYLLFGKPSRHTESPEGTAPSTRRSDPQT